MRQNPTSKTELRRSLLEQRQAIAADVRAEWDTLIGKQTNAWLLNNQPHILGIYMPLRGEPDLREHFGNWHAAGIQLALPVVIDTNVPLKFYAWRPGEPLEKDAMGVSVPVSRQQELQPDVVIVPCLGFNKKKYRLGYGGGFYDRTLAALPAKSLGVGYACQLCAFDVAPHDVPLDLVFTERDCLK